MQIGEAAERQFISRTLWERDRIDLLRSKFANADRIMRTSLERLDPSKEN
jgi:hypothetical protein